MVRFGVIGTNWITDSFLAAAQLDEHFRLTAVYSRTEEKAREFGAKYGVDRTFTDAVEMAASGEIDAVYIASPNSLHAEHAITAMNHGVHVLCEKPIASNSRELAEMIETAKRNNVLLMEAVKSTVMPGFRAAADNIGRIGKVRRYFASFCQYSSRYDAYKQGTVLNAFKPELSNGSLMDIGIYCIYPAVALFGRPKAVKAAGVMLESGVDGEGSLLLQYDDLDCVLMYSKITHSSLPTEIQGEDASIVIDKISTPTKVELVYRDGRTEDLTRPTVEHSMYYEAAEFIRLIREGRTESPINSREVSAIAMDIMDEARRQLGLRFPADER
jgi:Predicted dehydrogenases and related proteins